MIEFNWIKLHGCEVVEAQISRLKGLEITRTNGGDCFLSISARGGLLSYLRQFLWSDSSTLQSSRSSTAMEKSDWFVSRSGPDLVMDPFASKRPRTKKH